VKTTAAYFQSVFQTLLKFGFLIESDPKLISVCSLIVDEPMRGSWWSHPLAQVIFQVNEQLEDHNDVLMTKLISGKVTFVHRKLWSELITIARAREDWQMKNLSPPVKTLLGQIDSAGSLTTAEAVWPRQSKMKLGDAARELEKRLLIVGTQFHSESGAHQKLLETWEHWLQRMKFRPDKISSTAAKNTLEMKLKKLNDRYTANATLPWQ
jgi:hypothetical protein